MVTSCVKGPKTSILFMTLSWRFCNFFCSCLNVNRSFRSLPLLFFMSCTFNFFISFPTSLISGSLLYVLYVHIIYSYMISLHQAQTTIWPQCNWTAWRTWFSNEKQYVSNILGNLLSLWSWYICLDIVDTASKEAAIKYLVKFSTIFCMWWQVSLSRRYQATSRT